MDLGLAGKKAVVAGGSRGIGKAIAIELAREGVECVITSRNQSDLEKTAEEISSETGTKVVASACDVTDRSQVDAMIDGAAEMMGALHILVNSASLPGGSPDAIGKIDTIDDDAFLGDFNVKYLGALRCARAALPHMKKAGWGRIINISGGNARTPGNLSVGARNGSLVHFTRTLALQFGRDGITVNCIHPGSTRTERTPGMLGAAAEKKGISAQDLEKEMYAEGSSNGNAIGRMVEAQEVAYAAVFFASEQARAITGELICPNGGAGNAVWY
ncbi:MAG TPA: SDR family oxidoreductase [Rhodospirillaceae bacterium]|nr:SDR family oxidoreductase [Rhodospirillaceae bacterium]